MLQEECLYSMVFDIKLVFYSVIRYYKRNLRFILNFGFDFTKRFAWLNVKKINRGKKRKRV